MKFVVSLLGAITVNADDRTAHEDPMPLVERHLDDVMEELLDLEAKDATIDLEVGPPIHVRFAVLVEALNPLEAIDTASGEIRTAIHAAGGATPDWPTADGRAWSVRLVDVHSVELVPA